MNSEQRARDLLAQAFTELDCYASADSIRKDGAMTIDNEAALRAIARALEQPASAAGVEGFVMVPRDSLECAMQLLYSASNGRENIFADTAHEFRDLLAAPPKPEGSGHG